MLDLFNVYEKIHIQIKQGLGETNKTGFRRNKKGKPGCFSELSMQN